MILQFQLSFGNEHSCIFAVFNFVIANSTELIDRFHDHTHIQLLYQLFVIH